MRSSSGSGAVRGACGSTARVATEPRGRGRRSTMAAWRAPGVSPRISTATRGSTSPALGRRRRTSSGTRISGARRLTRFLVEPEYVAAGIAKACRDLGRVTADRLHDLAAVGDDLLDRRGDAIDHDVDENADLARRWSARLPGPAHFSDAVVERGATVAARSHAPPEHGLVERCRAFDVRRRHLDVTDLSVAYGGRHAGFSSLRAGSKGKPL